MTLRILIVGTVFAGIRTIEAWLEEAGFEVVIATNWHDGLTLCRKGRADVVLLEGFQPDLDGFGFCRSIKSDETLRHLPVGLIVPEVEPRDALQALTAQADEYFAGPLAKTPFLLRVHGLADLSVRTRELSRLSALSDGGIPTVTSTGADVLLLDPDPRSCQRLAEVLAPEFAVAAAAHAEGAVACMAAKTVDVMICDCGALLEQEPMHTLLLHQLRLMGLAGKFRLIGLAESLPAVLDPQRTVPWDDILLRPICRSDALARVRVAARRRSLSRALDAIEARFRGMSAQDGAFRDWPQNRLAA